MDQMVIMPIKYVRCLGSFALRNGVADRVGERLLLRLFVLGGRLVRA